MNAQNELQLRLTDETFQLMPANVRRDKMEIAKYLTTSVASASLDFPATVILTEAREFSQLADRLEILRLRLRTAKPANADDADLAKMIQSSHDEIRACLAQMAITLNPMEALFPAALGVIPPQLTAQFRGASAAAIRASESDPAGVNFHLGLLLVAMAAVVPPSDAQMVVMLERAQAQNLLPAGRMLGVPDFKVKMASYTPHSKPHKFRVKVTPSTGEQLENLALRLGWSANECANQLLQVHATSPITIQDLVQFHARGETARLLNEGIATLRAFADESILQQLKGEARSERAEVLSAFENAAVLVETRGIELLHPLIGSAWVYSADFLHSLDPLLTIIHQLTFAQELSTGSHSMVDYLKTLKIIPTPPPV